MRKYRGLTKDGKWVYGWYIKSESNERAYIVTSATGYDESPTEIEHLQVHGRLYIHEYYRVIPETVGQQIGKQDKNGKEIYKGDILRYAELLSDAFIMDKTARTVGLVSWMSYKCSFAPQEIRENHKGGHYIALWDSIAEIEVIGDIHTTPDLMEKGK